MPAWRRLGVLERLRPRETAGWVWEVDLEGLAGRGIRGLVLDLDNTLVNWNSDHIRPEVSAWLDRAKRLGFSLCISSNAHSPRRVRRLSERLGTLCVTHAGKPRARAFTRPMEIMGTTPETTAVVGDQLFTDILGGNRAGVHTVLVRPLGWFEFPGTMISRLLERVVLALPARPRSEESR